MAPTTKGKSDLDIGERAMWLVVLLVVALLLGLVAINFRDRRGSVSGNVMPPAGIEELFACGDYCPGPVERYTKRVYSGVKSEEDCKAFGGKWQSFVGWGTTYYCEVR